MNKRIAIFPGSFDPLTFGHLDLIERLSQLFDEVIVLIAVNTSKQSLFTLTERQQMIKQETEDFKNVIVDYLENELMVEYLKKVEGTVIVRGIRNTQDFEYEQSIAVANQQLFSECETLFMCSKPQFRYISSSLIKEIARFKGDISAMVPATVKNQIEIKFASY